MCFGITGNYFKENPDYMLKSDNCFFRSSLIPGKVYSTSLYYEEKIVASTGDLLNKENILLLLERGNMSFTHGQDIYNLAEHQLIFIKKNILLRFQCSPATAFVVFVLKSEIVLEFAKLAQLGKRPHIISEEMLVSDTADCLLSYVTSLKPLLSHTGFMNENLGRIKLLELLFCLSENNHPVLAQILDLKGQFHHNVSEVVEENIMNSLTLAQLARLAGRSVSSFRRDFLFIYNMSPSRWIRQRKLEKSQELLLSTTMTVTSICYTLGFRYHEPV